MNAEDLLKRQLWPLKRSKQLKAKVLVCHAMWFHLATIQSTWSSGSNKGLDTLFTGTT
ncbi:hypothetical protein YQE_10630, partial [Dendroctonus ponderosae]